MTRAGLWFRKCINSFARRRVGSRLRAGKTATLLIPSGVGRLSSGSSTRSTAEARRREKLLKPRLRCSRRFPDEIIARAETIQPDEPVWARLIWYYQQAARLKKAQSPFIARSRLILEQATEPEVRANVAFHLAQVLWDQGQKEEAKAAFELSRAAAPSRWTAQKAERYLFELENLKVGQQAPVFSGTALDGSSVRLEEYRGKVVLLNFWATWCAPCVAEIPFLLKMQKRFGKTDFVVLWISGDYERQALEDMVAGRKLPGPQIFDGKGMDGPIPALYNVQEWPRNFLLDPQGMILAKDSHGEALERAIQQALQD